MTEKKEAQIGDGYINHTNQEIIPAMMRFVTAEHVAEECDLPIEIARKLITMLNKEQQEQGRMAFGQRITRGTWEEYLIRRGY